MIPRKPNLLITQLSDKRLRCPANTSSQAGKVQGSRTVPSGGRLSLVFGEPQSSALIGATEKRVFPSGTSTRLGRRTEMDILLCCVFSLFAFKSETLWILSPYFGEQMGGIPLTSMGILLLALFRLSEAQPGICSPSLPGRRHERQIQSCQGSTETLPSTFSRFKCWSR